MEKELKVERKQGVIQYECQNRQKEIAKIWNIRAKKKRRLK